MHKFCMPLTSQGRRYERGSAAARPRFHGPNGSPYHHHGDPRVSAISNLHVNNNTQKSVQTYTVLDGCDVRLCLVAPAIRLALFIIKAAVSAFCARCTYEQEPSKNQPHSFLETTMDGIQGKLLIVVPTLKPHSRSIASTLALWGRLKEASDLSVARDSLRDINDAFSDSGVEDAVVSGSVLAIELRDSIQADRRRGRESSCSDNGLSGGCGEKLLVSSKRRCTQ
jgi:hypothetical protein